ncbi:alpha-E domain-containing protein, partial [Escherichia coli]
VLDLLLLDEQNPHAVIFQMRTLLRSLEGLNERFELPAERYLVYLEQQLTAFSLASLENPLFGPGSTRAVLEGLADLLVAISEAAGAVSDHLGLRFFAHVDVS